MTVQWTRTAAGGSPKRDTRTSGCWTSPSGSPCGRRNRPGPIACRHRSPGVLGLLPEARSGHPLHGRKPGGLDREARLARAVSPGRMRSRAGTQSRYRSQLTAPGTRRLLCHGRDRHPLRRVRRERGGGSVSTAWTGMATLRGANSREPRGGHAACLQPHSQSQALQ